MKNKIYSCFIFFIFGFMCFVQMNAEELLLKAHAAHGRDRYKEVKSITYQKRINHFDASGAVLDTVIENHTIDFLNSTSQFSWRLREMILPQYKARIQLRFKLMEFILGIPLQSLKWKKV